MGGGTAGWLTAALLAAQHASKGPDGVCVTLIESPDIATIGVGEGTWPTMRKTLRSIGIDENTFLNDCNASYKQGSRFDRWVTGADNDSYLHPFSAPPAAPADQLISAWQTHRPDLPFAQAVSPQADICAMGLAPKLSSMPGFAGALNYGYHLDAVRLAETLCAHATRNLGVRHIRDHVVGVKAAGDGDIAAIKTRGGRDISGDLFIDCTGMASVLLGGHYGIAFENHENILFNDRALTAQIAVDADSPIASQTISTAHEAGWIWDIGLPTRRGIGCVYASRHMSDERAETVFADYITHRCSDRSDQDYTVRKLSFATGHRTKFWHRNCVAIGLSAGFLEPLEASAIVLVELSAACLGDTLPKTRAAMDFASENFNRLFRYRWSRVIEFLKLHYVLSQRSEPFWQEHRKPEHIPERLQNLLATWQTRAPSQADFHHIDEMFPAASYQYILYGMGFKTDPRQSYRALGDGEMRRKLDEVTREKRKLAAGLPTNRACLSALRARALQHAGEVAAVRQVV